MCVSVHFYDETFWLTQKEMAGLFEVNIPAISKHLTNIYAEEELQEQATVSKMEIVRQTKCGNWLPMPFFRQPERLFMLKSFA